MPALLALVRGTLANIEEAGLEAAVTGPIPRGDVETVGLHLRALEPDDRKLYALLGRHLVQLADRYLDDDVRREILGLLENP